MNIPVFDLHCDTAFALLGSKLNKADSLRRNHCHVSLERAKNLSGYAQCFACYTTPDMEEKYQKSVIQIFEMELANIHRQVEANSDWIAIAYTPSEIENNYQSGKMSAILTLEGTAGIGYDPALLPDLYQIGFRITSLGWNESNPLTGSHLTGEGLSDKGREYVRTAQKLGMLVDVSHISDQGFWDIMDITCGPVIASHSNSRKVCPHSRNITDDMFRAVCSTGGVAGINLYRDFIGGTGDLQACASHILHFLEIDPTGKHISLGGDLDGCDSLVSGFTGVESYPALAQCLLQNGVNEDMIMDLFWNNAIGVLKNAVCNNKK